MSKERTQREEATALFKEIVKKPLNEENIRMLRYWLAESQNQKPLGNSDGSISPELWMKMRDFARTAEDFRNNAVRVTKLLRAD